MTATDEDDTPPRILVVDDNDLIRNLIFLILHGRYRVDIATGLTDAQRMTGTRRYDALVVDVRLGDGTGVDLIDVLRRADPDTAGRCLLVSGWPDDPTPAGVPVLHKPFAAAELTAAVRALADVG